MTAARPSVLDALRQSTPLTREVTLCTQGALQAEYDALSRALVHASIKAKDEDSLAADADVEVKKIAKRMDAVHQKMAAFEVVFTFRAVPWMRNLTLKAEHPPRDGDILDRVEGYNVETYTPALIKEACASIRYASGGGKPETEVPDDVLDELLSTRNIEEVEVLRQAALQANERVTTVPPSARSLLGSQDSGASSKSPGPGTSPQNGSTAGSRRGSRKSTATKKVASSG